MITSRITRHMSAETPATPAPAEAAPSYARLSAGETRPVPWPALTHGTPCASNGNHQILLFIRGHFKWGLD